MFSQVFNCGKTCFCTFAYGDGHLECSSGAVSGCKKPRERCLEIVVENQCGSVKACAGFFGKIGCASTSECYE